jgi:hypothetical protein
MHNQSATTDDAVYDAFAALVYGVTHHTGSGKTSLLTTATLTEMLSILEETKGTSRSLRPDGSESIPVMPRR